MAEPTDAEIYQEFLDTTDDYGVIAANIQNSKSERERVLSGNIDYNSPRAWAEVQYLLKQGSAEARINYYSEILGVSQDFLYDTIVSNVGNFEVGGEALSSRYEEGDEAKVKESILKQDKKVDEIIALWISTDLKEKTSRSLDSYLETEAGKAEIKKLVELAVDDRLLISKIIGWRESSVKPRNRGITDTLRALTGDEPSDPVVDQEKLKDLTDAEAKQCVLLSLLKPLTELQAAEMADKTGPSDGYPYAGRIVKMNSDNPSTFINYLSSINGANKNLANKKAKDNIYNNKTILEYRLSFIRSYQDELIELPIFFAGGFDYSKNSNGVEIKPDPDLTNRILSKVTKFNIDVNYEGNNPSTYRSDVDVTITIASNTMTTFLQKWKYDGYVDDEGKKIPFTLFDLILFPYLEKDSKGYGKAYKSQYSPSYNRLRLAYRNRMSSQRGRDKEMVDFFENNTNVLDLAIVDHEFKRDEEGKNHELVIRYRGYIQSVLTSPETDILSTLEIKRKRKERDLLLKKAIDENCSIREVQKIQQKLNLLAQNDVQDVSSGIMTQLYVRGLSLSIKGLGIYRLNVNDTLKKGLASQGSIALDKIKKLIIAGNGKNIIDSQDAAKNSTSLGQEDAELFSYQVSMGGDQIYFFYLADLLDAAILNSSIFYPDDQEYYNKFDSPINKEIIAQKIRFIFGSFKGPPEDNNAQGDIYNIGDIPISVEYFLNWYEENVTKKELYIYPCLSFIRDFTEKVITNLLNQICFGDLEEAKVLVRTSFFTGSKINNLEPLYQIAESDYKDPDKLNRTPIDLDSIAPEKLPLIKTGFQQNIKDYINYCAIYTRDNRTNSANISRNVEIIDFKYDYDETRFGAQTIAFSKTSQQGLRESRYARNGGSGITMLGGVYNASIKLTHPLNFIYPGQFFQISLFEPPGSAITLPNGQTVGIFEELGLSGYYSITKSTHKLNMKNKTNEATVSGIWVGSKSPLEYRPASEKKNLDQPASSQCQEYVNLSEELGARQINPIFNLTDAINSISEPSPAPNSEDRAQAPPPAEQPAEAAPPEPANGSTPPPTPPAVPSNTETERVPGTDSKNPSGYNL